MQYKLLNNALGQPGGVQKSYTDQNSKVTVVIVPNDPKNRDWQEFQKWIAAGNEPDPVE